MPHRLDEKLGLGARAKGKLLDQLCWECVRVVSAAHFTFLSLLHKVTDKPSAEDTESNSSEGKIKLKSCDNQSYTFTSTSI